jgi:hypothetical protein
MIRSIAKLAGLLLVLLVLVGALVAISMIMLSEPVGAVVWGATLVVGVPILVLCYRRRCRQLSG